MRTLIAAILAIFIIIGGWFYLYKSIEKNTFEFINTLDTISLNIQKQDWNRAFHEFNKIQKKWNKTRNLWTTLLDHHEIDNIDLSMAKADQYVKSKDISLSLGEIETLKKLFRIVKENEALTLTNIL
ncbi:DUF4363 family protein [Crassaminicella thermophila]|uniref:DUF4363 family protein n=1 Tax=Crassaminicella thermophila TaxID=2599308 RepID=A0A5C0SIC2_CRATE|nr:DUF4363 family protein [Crassaminicella thermophila]QEK13184.1 DUF4363 family protein [Crassaminicella thermophila]